MSPPLSKPEVLFLNAKKKVSAIRVQVKVHHHQEEEEEEEEEEEDVQPFG